MCVDYRALNNITVKDIYPLPRIQECLNAFKGSKYFTKIDLTSGFWQLLIRAQDYFKTAFNTRQGKYQFKVMPFGLTNAPATFQTLINKILSPHLYKNVIVYLDDIVVFLKTLKEHKKHLEQVFLLLGEYKLYTSSSKCAIRVQEFDFCGHRVT